METVKLNGCRIAPRKMRLVVDTIRGKSVSEAIYILRYVRKKGAPYVERLLLSAMANWENKNPDLPVEEADLYVKEIFVTSGKTIKRFKPRAKGRATPILKRSNNVTLTIAPLVDYDPNDDKEVDDNVSDVMAVDDIPTAEEVNMIDDIPTAEEVNMIDDIPTVEEVNDIDDIPTVEEVNDIDDIPTVEEVNDIDDIPTVEEVDDIDDIAEEDIEDDDARTDKDV